MFKFFDLLPTIFWRFSMENNNQGYSLELYFATWYCFIYFFIYSLCNLQESETLKWVRSVIVPSAANFIIVSKPWTNIPRLSALNGFSFWKTHFRKCNEHETWSVGTRSEENSNEHVPAGTWWRHHGVTWHFWKINFPKCDEHETWSVGTRWKETF